MSTDDTRPHLLDELGRTVTVDEYLNGELPDRWTAKRGGGADETVIRSDDIDLFIHAKPDYGKEAVHLYRSPSRAQPELVIQERVDGFDARKMAYDLAISWSHVIAATIEGVTDE
jgi:hypothetical protein